jgi:hypothetical protein
MTTPTPTNENPQQQGTAQPQQQQPLSRDDVTAEIQRAWTDPTHPHHQGFKFNSPSYSKWADSLYARIPGVGTGKLEFDPPVIGPGGLNRMTGITVVESTEDAAAHQELRSTVDATIAERNIDTSAMRAESERLFAGLEGRALLDLLDDRTLAGLAPGAKPLAHVAMASWLADLAALRAQGGAEEEGIAPAAFQAAYERALQAKGIDVRMVENAVDGIFAGKPEAYKHFVKKLDAFPASQRLAAYVRSAEAAMMFVRLRQYVA